jgi:hypothetical protein
MQWSSPTVVEIKMDAEIGSYQEDNEPTRESPIASPEPRDDAPAATR